MTISIPFQSNTTRWLLAGLASAIAASAIALSIPAVRRYALNPAAAPAVATNEVEIHANALQSHVFSPAVIAVPVGSTVTWHFLEVDGEGQPVPHNVVFDDRASPVLATGRWSRTFTATGDYSYVCSLHPGMNGRVIVTGRR